MVKADMSRDYYGDLEIQPTADLNEIKKQFKKLALTYHPDRNPGRESEVTAKFQRIQSAHEVLSDPTERQKYDGGRIKANGHKTGYQGASGVRGNPWSNVSAQYPPPPKPPGTRQRPPPPSAGAARYKNFETPKTTAYQTAQEGAEARKRTYEAWESMRGQDAKAQPSPRPPPTWKPTAPPRDYTTPSSREESNKFKHPPPPKARPGYEEYRANYSPNPNPHRRAQSTGAANRKGFVPGTPGGDEGPAPKGAYFTQHKPQQAPEPPPRGPPGPPPGPPPASMNHVQPDPLRQFRERADPTYEPRISTPYATHGGEKFNPFENANLNRSKSTRERPDRPGDSPSDSQNPNKTFHRSRSFAERAPPPTMKSSTDDEDADTSSSDDGPIPSSTQSRKFAKVRSNPTTGTSKGGQRMPEAATRPEHIRKPSNVSQFQKWYRENPGAEPPLNGFPSDGPGTGSGQATHQTNGEPTMYASPRHSSLSAKISANSPYSIKLPTVSETISPKADYFGKIANTHLFDSEVLQKQWPSLYPNAYGTSPAVLPSGVAADTLNPFEEGQRSLVDHLVNKRHTSDGSSNSSVKAPASQNGHPNQKENIKAVPTSDDILNEEWPTYEEPAKMEKVPYTKQEPNLPMNASRTHENERAHKHIASERQKTNANDYHFTSRFSFKVDDSTFANTIPQPNRFKSPSAETINTKFTPEEWEGKFQAGQDYFQPEHKTANVPHPRRTQSGSRSRGRSPIKIRPIDPTFTQPRNEPETPIESPGGTTFTPEEWAQSFKPQTFMPPPTPNAKPAMPARPAGARKGRVPSIRPTMGTAAVVDDGETSDEKPLFTGRKSNGSTMPPSPDAMEIDTPPVVSTSTEMPNTKGGLNITTEPLKRPAAPSQSPTEATLKVNFEDLKIADLISSLDLPKAPTPPKIPESPHPEYTRPPKPAYEKYLEEFKSYMRDWDLFNSRIMLHLVARKNQNDTLGTRRWEHEKGLETYRMGLKEDRVVLGHLGAAQEVHMGVLKEFAILKERMKERGERERPRKKVY